MIFPGGFKQFNSTLTKTEIQIRSSSRHLKRLPVQINMKFKVFRNLYQSTRSFENFGGGSVGCLKIIEDKASNANLADAEVTFQPQTQASCQTRGSCFNPNADLTSFIKRRGRVPTSDANPIVSAKCEGCTIL